MTEGGGGERGGGRGMGRLYLQEGKDGVHTVHFDFAETRNSGPRIWIFPAKQQVDQQVQNGKHQCHHTIFGCGSANCGWPPAETGM